MTAPADTLPAALDALQTFELRPGTERWSYYVRERLDYLGPGLHPLQQAWRDLQREAGRPEEERRNVKVLVSGHKGTGKSTELYRVAKSMEGQYEVVTCSLGRYLNAADVDARDVLFVLAARLIERLETHRALALLDEDPAARAAFQMLRTRLPKLRVEEAGFNLLGILTAKLKIDGGLRSELRRVTAEQPEDLLALVNRPIAHLEAVVERPVLLVLDDLDKVGQHASGRAEIFTRDFSLLTSLAAAGVYTIPIEVFYDPQYSPVVHHRPRVTVEHIKLWTDRHRQQRFEPGWAVMRAFVSRRMAVSLVDDATLDLAIEWSGGSFEQLRRMLHDAIDAADYAGRHRVERADLDYATRLIRTDLVRMFGAFSHIESLHRIHVEQSLQPPGDLQYLPLLAVMEYLNDNIWYDVNPLLLPYVIERWEEAKR